MLQLGCLDDLEAGRRQRDRADDDDDDDDDDQSLVPYDHVVRNRNAPSKALRRWQLAACVIKASLRFWVVLDSKNDRRGPGTPESPFCPTHTGKFDISSEELVLMSREQDLTLLQRNGGIKGLADRLNSNLEKGVPEEESDIIDRKKVFGANTYPRKKPSFWRFLWEACKDIFLIILMVCAAALMVLGIKTEGIRKGWYDGLGIAAAVLIIIPFTAVSDYRKSLKFQELNEEKRKTDIEVIRTGRRRYVSISEIVVGDVVPLKIGDQIPGNGLVISSHSLAIDECNMTGESKLVHKNSRAPFLMSGTHVADGYGSMLVTSVGTNTEWGLLMASISEDNYEETPLQTRVNSLTTSIGVIGLAIAGIIFVVLLIRFFAGHTKNPNGSIQFIAGKTKVFDAIDGFIKIFSIAVAIVIVAVPEGLPLNVTQMLAHSIRKILADHALLRRLSACETMGCASTICVNKTGTLTLNQMRVVEAYSCGTKIETPDNPSLVSPTVVSLLFEGVAHNTSGSVFLPEDSGAFEYSGSPTEKAILHWGVNLGMEFDTVRSVSTVIHACPFNSRKKKGGVAIKSHTEVHVHWKGAAETVLRSCTSYVDANDSVIAMNEEKLSFFMNSAKDMAARSLRCVAFAYRPYPLDSVPTIADELEDWQLPEEGLILLAIVGIKDPCRPGVRDAVQLCINAGIKVRMVTGDSLHTAKAIAVECGILGREQDATEPNVIEGRVFRSLSEAQRLEVADRISVMGRSSPNDKLLLLQSLRKRGHVVAITGEGVDDAPSLNEADIGLAMGIQGTDVAKQSSDIIVLDDNFASVVKVVRWGRAVYANIQKIILFQLTVIIAALAINFVAAVFCGAVPLNAVQLLWTVLVMDTLGAFALATEPPTDSLMHRPPIGRREPLITNIMWRNSTIQTLYQVTILSFLNFQGRSILNLGHDSSGQSFEVKNTLIFNSFILCQIFNLFNARKPDEINVWKGISRNHLFLGIVSLTVVLQVVIILFLGKFTSTVQLSRELWFVSTAIGFVSWPLAAVGKLIPVPERPFSKFFLKRYHRRNFVGNTESRETLDLESDWNESSLEVAMPPLNSVAAGDKLANEKKASKVLLAEDFDACISDFGFTVMGFPAIPSRSALYLEPPELKGTYKLTVKYGSTQSLCILLLGLLNKAAVWSGINNEVVNRQMVAFQSTVREEHTGDVSPAEIKDGSNAQQLRDPFEEQGEGNDLSGEGNGDETCNT